MAGLLDLLLNRTRFDQKNTLDTRMKDAGIPPQGVAPGVIPGQPVQPVPQMAPPPRNDPDAMIRYNRAKRQAERDAQAAQYLQSMGGQVLPTR